MRFVQRDREWLLLDDGDGVLAVLRDEVEIVVLQRLCEHRLAGKSGGFEVTHRGKTYQVVPLVTESGQLSLEVRGDDGVS